MVFRRDCLADELGLLRAGAAAHTARAAARAREAE
jgi:hypothetical protein